MANGKNPFGIQTLIAGRPVMTWWVAKAIKPKDTLVSGMALATGPFETSYTCK